MESVMDDDEQVCEGYPEHDWETTYEGEDGWQGLCRRCGAESWQDADA